MKHVEEVGDLLYRIRRPGLLAVAEGRVRDENLVRRIDKNELFVELDATDLIVRKEMAIEIRLLDIKERKLAPGALAPECSLLSIDAHSSSFFVTNDTNESGRLSSRHSEWHEYLVRETRRHPRSRMPFETNLRGFDLPRLNPNLLQLLGIHL